MARVLLDTGLLLAYLYADAEVIPDPEKLAKREKGRRAIEKLLAEEAELLLPYQTIREAYATATRSRQSREGFDLSPQRASEDLLRLLDQRDLFTFLPEDEAILRDWLDMIAQYQITGNRAFDAYLAAFARRHTADYVLTYDEEVFRRLGIRTLRVA